MDALKDTPIVDITPTLRYLEFIHYADFKAKYQAIKEANKTVLYAGRGKVQTKKMDNCVCARCLKSVIINIGRFTIITSEIFNITCFFQFDNVRHYISSYSIEGCSGLHNPVIFSY